MSSSSSSTSLNLVHGQNKDTSCTLELFGGTLTSWKVEAVENILVSSKAIRDGSKAIRGGVPVCFPSFGPWEFGAQHGFARISKDWKVEDDIKVDPETGDAKVTLSLSDSEATRAQWDFPFKLCYTVTLKARSLCIDTKVSNTGDKDLDFTYCLHTYFKVPDVTRCEITGLSGLTFIDKVDGAKEKVEDREIVKVEEFTDRVYKRSPDSCVLKGLEGGRALKLEKTNFCDTVVWNPWAESAAKMSDFGDDEYKGMICVEAVQNTDRIKVKPGSSYDSNHTISVMD